MIPQKRGGEMKRTGNCLVNQVIIPAAGLGTRMLPITKALPKEMLPIGRKPIIQYILEELASVGVAKALIIISDDKEMIKKYFGDGRDLGLKCEYLVQRQMRGSGNAILEAEFWTDHKPFVVAWGDCISTAKPQNARAELPVPLARLIQTFDLLRPDFAVLAKKLRGVTIRGLTASAFFTIQAWLVRCLLRLGAVCIS
jgi:UTP-glucose-1-phosphate uridylyltransferase